MQVAPTGRVAAADVLQGSGIAELDRLVAEAVQRCRLPVLEQAGAAVGSSFGLQFTLRTERTAVAALKLPD